MHLGRCALLLSLSCMIGCSARSAESASTAVSRAEGSAPATTAVASAPTASTSTAGASTAGTSTAGASSKPASGRAFFAGEGTRYAFRGEFRGKPQEVELELRGVDVNGERILHFADVGARGGLVAPTFGLGALAFRADGLYTADVLAVADIPKLQRQKLGLMLALPAKVGGKAAMDVPAAGIVPAKSERYEVAAIERVTVPAGTFDDCVKLAVATEIDGERETSTVWLAPGVGPVKLARATGRVDELTKLTPAPAP